MSRSFEQRVARVTARRSATYGGPRRNFARIVALKAVLAPCPDRLAREALEQIAVKMARLIESPGHRDSWIDIAGYARCGAAVTAKRKRKSKRS